MVMTKDAPVMNRVRRKVREWAELYRQILQLRERVDAQLALQALHPLLQQGHFLPITGSTLRMRSLQIVANDIIVNRRARVVEFGSGVSTIVLARLAKANALPMRLHSVESDETWLGILQNILKSEGLLDHVDLVFAPLGPSLHAIDELAWYSQEPLDAALPKDGVDLVLVDGPNAHAYEIRLSRYAAMPCLESRLAPSHSIYLDDFDRAGEQEVVQRWEERFGLEFTQVAPGLARASRGGSYIVA